MNFFCKQYFIAFERSFLYVSSFIFPVDVMFPICFAVYYFEIQTDLTVYWDHLGLLRQEVAVNRVFN